MSRGWEWGHSPLDVAALVLVVTLVLFVCFIWIFVAMTRLTRIRVGWREIGFALTIAAVWGVLAAIAVQMGWGA